MKSVLISIQPKWVEKIAKGEKTIEVRKTKPNLGRPFKCYIYCTKDKKYGGMILGNTKIPPINFGKVIGEFICNRVLKYECSSEGFGELATTCGTCLTYDDILNYCGGQDLYGWHISDLKIYNNPKELSEFRTICKTYKNGYDLEKCCECKKALFDEDGAFYGCDNRLTRPPQSWCYVEEL